MPVVNLPIQTKIYQLSCEEGDEPRILALAEQLNTRLHELAIHAPGSGEVMQMIMLMLMMQDELNEANDAVPKKASKLSGNHEDIVIQALDTVSGYLENLAKKLATR